MKRIWHHYARWEEVPAGMWSRDRSLVDIGKALTIMRDVPRWKDAMRAVVQTWPLSAEQNLSHTQHNRVAWLGQAAVCLAAGQPAASTREAWWSLTEGERGLANAAARAVIAGWEATQCLVSQ